MFLSFSSFAQLTLAEKQILDKYFASDYPLMKFSETMDETMRDYSFKAAVYCKNHPPFPKLLNNGFSQDDVENYNKKVNEWVRTHGHQYPAFIEYHKYGKTGRTLEDDINAYENAKEEWIKSHPAEFKEMESIIKKMESKYFIPAILPDDFPVFIDTGNEMRDLEKYDEEVGKWKKRNKGYENINIFRVSYSKLKN